MNNKLKYDQKDLDKKYTADDIARHREESFLAGRIAEVQSLKTSYASKTYNSNLHRTITMRIKRYRKQINMMNSFIKKQENTILKIKEDIYNFIKYCEDSGDIVAEDIVAEYMKVRYFHIDDIIELCQALKAWPNVTPIEELYYVKFIDKTDGYLNQYNVDTDLSVSCTDEVDGFKTKFTLDEIKAIDERYLPFVVKVEDE